MTVLLAEREAEALFPRLVGNRALLRTRRYAAILGEAPSRGARSPRLWNAAFAALGMDAAMLPLDVTAAALPALLAALRRDPRFLGAAIAVPHKAAAAAAADQLDGVAEASGAANLLVRREGMLSGANTDGAAARAVLRRHAGPLAGRTVLLLGAGGTARAVAAALAHAGASVIVANRSRAAAAALAARVPGVSVVPWPPMPSVLAAADILVNATSLGHAPEGTAPPALTPLSAATHPGRNRAESAVALAALSAHAFVFDAIYQPAETALLALARARGLWAVNGAAMNLEQAVRAFCLAVPGSDPGIAREAMEHAAG